MKKSEQTHPCTLQSAETLKIHHAQSPAVEGLGGLSWASPLHAGMLHLCAHPHAHGSYPTQNTAHPNLNSHPVSEACTGTEETEMPGGMWIQRGGPSPSSLNLSFYLEPDLPLPCPPDRAAGSILPCSPSSLPGTQAFWHKQPKPLMEVWCSPPPPPSYWGQPGTPQQPSTCNPLPCMCRRK